MAVDDAQYLVPTTMLEDIIIIKDSENEVDFLQKIGPLRNRWRMD